MEQPRKQLSHFKRIAELYLEHLVLYRRQLSMDQDLPPSSQRKLSELLDDFLNQLEDFLTTLAQVQKTLLQTGGATSDQIGRTAEMQQRLYELIKYFDRLAGTSPKLTEIKRKIDDQIQLHGFQEQASKASGPAKKSSAAATPPPPPVKLPAATMKAVPKKAATIGSAAVSKKKSETNERWMDSLINEIKAKNEKFD